MAGGSLGASARRDAAGRLHDGTAIEAVTLAAANGVSARILTYGATLQGLTAPDRNGVLDDVLLGCDDLAGYVEHRGYFGVIVGRYANRIASGRFELDGEVHQIPLNDGANALHGGPWGFDQRPWRIVSTGSGPEAHVTLALESEHGDQGFPGRLETTVTYALDGAGALTVSFEAHADRPTIVNLTNHAVFNLAGEASAAGAMGHRLTIPARTYTPVDARLIPTGDLRPVAGTVFDFTQGRVLADGLRDGRDAQVAIGRGYDHNFALDKGLTARPELAARLEDPQSGRVLEVLTTEPGLQLYSGNALDGTFAGKGGRLYRMGDGIALEPQKFPDAPNQPTFVSPRVDPARPYRHVMVYRLSVGA